MLLHAFAANPPTVAVLPFLLRQRKRSVRADAGRRPAAALGPWPRFAHFDLTLARRYSYRGRRRSYLSASCPIPRRLTAGFFSFARADLTLAGGREIGASIARSCRGR